MSKPTLTTSAVTPQEIINLASEAQVSPTTARKWFLCGGSTMRHAVRTRIVAALKRMQTTRGKVRE